MRQKLLLAALCMCLVQSKCPPLRDALKAYDMIEVRPPSTFLMPGTLVWISSERPLVAGRLCSFEKTMGASWKASESKTMNTELTKAVKRGINFQVDVQSFLNASGDLSSIKDVSLSLRNARLYELMDDDLTDRPNELDTRCLRALQRRQRGGFRTSIISAALVADLQYHVRFSSDANLTIQAKIAQLEALSAHLGLESSTVTDKTITAEGLVIGAKTDDFLAYLYSPTHLKQADKRQSIIPSQWDGVFVNKEDANATTANGDMPTLASSAEEDDYWSEIEVTEGR